MGRLLMLAGLCALLSSVGLLAGHWAVRSPQQLDELVSGSYGAMPASLGRCVQRLQPEPAPSAEKGPRCYDLGQQRIAAGQGACCGVRMCCVSCEQGD